MVVNRKVHKICKKSATLIGPLEIEGLWLAEWRLSIFLINFHQWHRRTPVGSEGDKLPPKQFPDLYTLYLHYPEDCPEISPRCIHVILNCEILDGTLEGVAEKKKCKSSVFGFNILCNFWNLSPNRSFDCRARGSEELCFNFKGAHFQQRLQTFIALWTRSKLSHGFVKIDTWILLHMLLHGFVKIDPWISFSCYMDFLKELTFNSTCKHSLHSEQDPRYWRKQTENKRKSDKVKCIWVENNCFVSILRLKIVRLY